MSESTELHFKTKKQFDTELLGLQKRANRAFLCLMYAQWAFCVFCAFVISPFTWFGSESQIHIHVWTSVLLGGAIVTLPTYLIVRHSHSAVTRWVVASAQMAFSGLIVHMMAGRIEAHFHFFGVLAFLSVYRDRRVYIPAITIAFVDHVIRGVFYPESVFGISNPTVFRAFEHAAWVLFESMFLLWGVGQSRQQLWRMSRLQVELADERDKLEKKVDSRTKALYRANTFLDNVWNTIEIKTCIVDQNGKILKANSSWQSFGIECGILPEHRQNIFEYASQIQKFSHQSTDPLLQAIDDVINEQDAGYSAEFDFEIGGQQKSYSFVVCPIILEDGLGAMVMQECITERVAAQRELVQQKEHAERLALVAKFTDNAVYIANEANKIEWANEGFTRMTGYTLEDVKGKDRNHLDGDAATSKDVIRFMDEQIKQHAGYDLEVARLDKSNQKYWVAVELRPIQTESGENKFIGIERDITHRIESQEELALLNLRQMEQNNQLAQERRLLNTIINSVPIGLFWKDVHSVYQGCNEAFAKMAMLESPEDIKGLSDDDLPWKGDVARQYRKRDRKVINEIKDTLNYEEVRMVAGGFLKNFASSKTPLCEESGRIVGIVGAIADITKQKQGDAERARLFSEASELARVVRESPLAVFIADRDTRRFVDANQGAVNESGYSLEELQTMTPSDLNPEFNDHELDELFFPLDIGEVSILEFQSTHQRKNGETHPVQIQIHATEYRGKPVYIAFVSDLTKVKDLESQLAQSQKLESIGQLSAGIAHEINTPLQFVGTNIEFLSASSERLLKVVDRYHEILHSDEPISWEERRETIHQLAETCRFDKVRTQVPQAISECMEGIQRTVKILKAMKDFSHPGDREKVDVDLNEAIDSTLTISRNRWKYAAKVELDLDRTLPKISAHAAELNQVLLNLVVNAADAIADRYGDGNLGQIHIRTYCDGDSAVVEVQDNGGGIPDELVQKIFDPFFTTKGVGKGTGQGLAIARDVIVNLHQGRLDVKTTTGEGSTFTIELPLHPTDTQNHKKEANAFL